MKTDLRRLSLLTTAFIVILAAGDAQALPKLFKKKNKNPEAVPAGAELREADMIANDIMARARADEAAGREKAALKGYESIVSRYPYTSMAPEAQFRIAAALEQDRKFEDAFQAYQNLISRYRRSPQFSEAIDRQYGIATLSRTKRTGRTLGFKVRLSSEEVIAMLKQVIANAPHGVHAAEAQFEIAAIHEEEDQPDQAIAAYKKVADNYPTSPLAADARSRIGQTYMAKVEGGSRDRSNVSRARDAADEASLFGGVPPDLLSMQGSIDEAATESSYSTGKFYQKRGNYKAAMMYYADILRNPGSANYEEVRERVNEMKAKEPGLMESMKHLALDSRSLAVPASSNLKNKGDYFGPPGPPAPRALANAARSPEMRSDYVPEVPLEPADLPLTPGTPDNSLLDPTALPPVEPAPPPAVPEVPAAPEPPRIDVAPLPEPPPDGPVEEKPAVPVEEQPKD
jgi:outer membrane protein assembly factor BamD